MSDNRHMYGRIKSSLMQLYPQRPSQWTPNQTFGNIGRNDGRHCE